MSEQLQEQAFGKESVERSLGYVPADVPMPREESQGDISIQETELRDAANEIVKDRNQRQREVESRPYDSKVEVRDTAADKLPEEQTLTAEEASWLVTGARTKQENTADLDDRAELAKLIDEMRNGTSFEQLHAQSQEQAALSPNDVTQQPQPQPEQTPPVDDDWQRHLQDPRILNAVQQHVEQANAQAIQAAQNYNAAAVQAANSALIGLAMTYPELQGCTAQQLPVALNVIARQNPQRAQDIINHCAAITDTLKRGVEAQQQQQWQQYAQYRKQFSSWAATQDAAYEAYARKVTPAERQAIETEARAMVLEGNDPQSVAMSWHTSTELRSAQAQRILFEAARLRLKEKTGESIKRKISRPVPHVQRPGSPVERIPDSDNYLKRLERPGQPLSVKEAAAFVTARRNARR